MVIVNLVKLTVKIKPHTWCWHSQGLKRSECLRNPHLSLHLSPQCLGMRHLECLIEDTWP